MFWKANIRTKNKEQDPKFKTGNKKADRFNSPREEPEPNLRRIGFFVISISEANK
jgi:hypothetical protein